MKFKSILAMITARNDLLIVVALLAVVMMMILPMPTVIVDIMIGLNMACAAILLMVAIYLKSPLELVAFPAILLLTTLFRLSLSITTTRLILLEGDAGKIVETFGQFVVGGNLVVGMVIFLIITIVQFVVITKGSERVAEVSARFSLDGMPGKQMSIDSDMRAGLIDMEEARKRRVNVEKESQLYGSMDGAMKFVKGDAIAGLIIILVNIVGGISIGMVQKGMDASGAIQLYSILTVGDGLVSQIPALIIAIASGIIVTRVTTDESEDLGRDIAAQVTAKPDALIISSVLMLAFAAIPGFPWVIFLVLAALTGGGGLLIKKRMARESDASALDTSGFAPASDPRDNRKITDQEEFTFVAPLLIDLSSELDGALDVSKLNQEILRVRRALYLDLGVPFPGIHLRFNENLQDGYYNIHLQETPIANGKLKLGHLCITRFDDQLDMFEIPYERADNFLPAADLIWVAEEHREALESMSLEFKDLHSVLTFHLSFVLKKYGEEFIGIQEARYLLEQMEEKYGELVKEAQRLLPIQKIAEIFRRLVSEDVSIRNLRLILESLVEWAQKEKETVLLTEYIRSSMKRYISYKFSSGNNMLPVYLLDQRVEETIRGAIRQTSAGAYLALDSSVGESIVNKLKGLVGNIYDAPNKPVVLTSMDIRRYVRKLIEQEIYELSVLSYQELTPEISVQPIGRIEL